MRTFLERDLPGLGIRVPGPALRRFWTMLAHWHGQVWNSSEFARSFGVADTTVRRYLDILTGALVVRQLQPWHANIAKRQVKAPKVYLRDTGVLHALLGIDGMQSLNVHPKSGASWEGLLLECSIDRLRLEDEQVHFWAAHTGAKLDLLITRRRKRIGIEIKRSTAPKVTPSMRSAQRDLGLSEVIVVHAGRESYPLGIKVRGVAAGRLDKDLGFSPRVACISLKTPCLHTPPRGRIPRGMSRWVAARIFNSPVRIRGIRSPTVHPVCGPAERAGHRRKPGPPNQDRDLRSPRNRRSEAWRHICAHYRKAVSTTSCRSRDTRTESTDDLAA